MYLNYRHYTYLWQADWVLPIFFAVADCVEFLERSFPSFLHFLLDLLFCDGDRSVRSPPFPCFMQFPIMMVEERSLTGIEASHQWKRLWCLSCCCCWRFFFGGLIFFALKPEVDKSKKMTSISVSFSNFPYDVRTSLELNKTPSVRAFEFFQKLVNFR